MKRFKPKHALAMICIAAQLSIPNITLAEQSSYVLGGSVSDYFTSQQSNWVVVSDSLKQALVAAEDRNFYDTFPTRSTITHYLAQQILPRDVTSHVEFELRKLELMIALANTLKHDQILTWYWNETYITRGCFGVADAADVLFGKSPDQLTLADAALLATIIKAPSYFDPVRHPDRAQIRRNFVLSEMYQLGFISDIELAQATEIPVSGAVIAGRCD